MLITPKRSAPIRQPPGKLVPIVAAAMAMNPLPAVMPVEYQETYHIDKYSPPRAPNADEIRIAIIFV